jgi:hypothetical protein
MFHSNLVATYKVIPKARAGVDKQQFTGPWHASDAHIISVPSALVVVLVNITYANMLKTGTF